MEEGRRWRNKKKEKKPHQEEGSKWEETLNEANINSPKVGAEKM
jgi:hypothetical protein